MQMPFQFSLHIQNEPHDEKLEHFEWISDHKHDPRKEIAEKIGLGNYCDFWMHNGLMEDADGKLSKSRGERITLEEVFQECSFFKFFFTIIFKKWNIISISKSKIITLHKINLFCQFIV